MNFIISTEALWVLFSFKINSWLESDVIFFTPLNAPIAILFRTTARVFSSGLKIIVLILSLYWVRFVSRYVALWGTFISSSGFKFDKSNLVIKLLRELTYNKVASLFTTIFEEKFLIFEALLICPDWRFFIIKLSVFSWISE